MSFIVRQGALINGVDFVFAKFETVFCQSLCLLVCFCNGIMIEVVKHEQFTGHSPKKS